MEDTRFDTVARSLAEHVQGHGAAPLAGGSAPHWPC